MIRQAISTIEFWGGAHARPGTANAEREDPGLPVLNGKAGLIRAERAGYSKEGL